MLPDCRKTLNPILDLGLNFKGSMSIVGVNPKKENGCILKK